MCRIQQSLVLLKNFFGNVYIYYLYRYSFSFIQHRLCFVIFKRVFHVSRFIIGDNRFTLASTLVLAFTSVGFCLSEMRSWQAGPKGP